MNSLILILLIQSGLLLLLPFLGMLFVLLFGETEIQKKIFSVIISIIFVGFAFSALGIFSHGFFNSTTMLVKQSVPIFLFYSYSFEFGLQVTLVQSLLYLTTMFVLALLLIYFSWKKPYWKIIHSGKISLYGLSIIFLLFSPNFFQLMFFVLVSDIFLIEGIQYWG